MLGGDVGSTLDLCSRHLPADRLLAVLPSALVQSLVLATAAIPHREPNLVCVNPRPDQAVVIVEDVHGQLHAIMFLLSDAGSRPRTASSSSPTATTCRPGAGLKTLLLLAGKVYSARNLCIFTFHLIQKYYSKRKKMKVHTHIYNTTTINISRHVHDHYTYYSSNYTY